MALYIGILSPSKWSLFRKETHVANGVTSTRQSVITRVAIRFLYVRRRRVVLCRAVRPSVRPSVCLSVRPSVGLSVRPSVRPSARPSVNFLCPLHTSVTVQEIFMKLGTNINHRQTMCREQKPTLHLHFLRNYGPLKFF